MAKNEGQSLFSIRWNELNYSFPAEFKIQCLFFSSVHGILQARILEWVTIPSPGDLPDPGIKPTSPALSGRFFTTTPPGKPNFYAAAAAVKAASVVSDSVLIWTSLGLSGKESTCQCRGWGFDPRVGKIAWRRKWQPTPIFLPRKFHEQWRLVGTVHGVRKESDTTWWLNNNLPI